MKALLIATVALLIGCSTYVPVKYYYLDMKD